MKILSTLLIFFLLFTIKCGEKLTADEAFSKGKGFYENKDYALAYKYFKKATEQSPENPQYHWAAARTAPDDNLALIHAKTTWENELKTFEVLLFLTKLSFYSDKAGRLEYALSLFEELPENSQIEELKGELFNRFEEYDSTLAIWTKIYNQNPRPDLANKIALAYGKKGDKDKALSFLKKCQREKRLDSQGYITLAYLMAFETSYNSIYTLFKEAKKQDLYDEKVQLEHAGFLILDRKISEAEKLLKTIVALGENYNREKRNQQARIMLGYIYLAEQDTAKLNKISRLCQKIKQVETEAELQYYDALKGIVQEKDQSLEELIQLRQDLPKIPLIDLTLARELAHRNDLTRAVSYYKALPDLYLHTPRITVEYATALSRLHKYEKALAVLNLLHKKKLYTKNSLELFRDITLKMNLIDKSMEAQSVLEKSFKDDASVYYAKALLLLKGGNVQGARKILSNLLEKHPEDNRFRLAHIKTFLLSEEYEQTLTLCGASKLDPRLTAPLMIQAYAKLNKWDLAEKKFQETQSKENSLSLMLLYAQELSNAQRYDHAKGIYNSIILEHGEKLQKDSVGYALLLNNYAWAHVSSKNRDEKETLRIAKKAHLQAPDNINVIDTYAHILVSLRKYKESIRLLRRKQYIELLNKEPKLQFHLAQAYEKVNERNRALRAYQEIISLLNSKDVDSKLAFTVKKDTIQKRIQELSSVR